MCSTHGMPDPWVVLSFVTIFGNLGNLCATISGRACVDFLGSICPTPVIGLRNELC